MSDYILDPNRPPTVKLSRDEWVNLVTTAVMEIGEEPIREAVRLALGPERADKLIEDKEGPRLSKRDNHAIIRAVYPLIPGDTRQDKIDWLIDKAAPCFIDENRFFEVLSYVRHRVEEFEAAGGSIDHYPDPPPVQTTITGKERGFIWKPVGENSGTLRVLFPEVWTGKVDRGSVELWRGGERIETLASTGVANGNREHFQARKPGGAYNADTQVRATAEGQTWVWTVAKPGSRAENLTAVHLGEAAPEAPPQEPADQFAYEPGPTSTKISVPRSFGVWKMHIFSRRKHVTLYGPDHTTGPSWTIPMSGAALKAASLAAGDDGSIMVFVNTSKEMTGGSRNAAWRIMDPTKPQSGDGDRLKAGEDR